MSSPANAETITRCTTGPVVTDTRPTDQLYARVPTVEVAGACFKYGRIRQADMAAVTVTFPNSGSLDDVKADVGGSEEIELVTQAARVTVSGEIATNISQVQSVLNAEAMAVVDAMVRKKLDALYAAVPPANAPRGLAYAAAQNPSGVLQPLRGVGEPPCFQDYLCMREALGVPWTAASPLFYVLPKALYYDLLGMAASGGSNGMLQYYENPVTRTVIPHICGTGALLSDHCPSNRAYLVMLDGDDTVAEGTRGFFSVHPEKNEETGQGGPNYYVGPVTADPANDLYFRNITHGYAWVWGSISVTGLAI